MPVIDKVSSLRNYQAVLEKVKPGNPVFLTKNGIGQYAIVDNAEYDALCHAAFGKLFEQLDAAREEARTEGWIELNQARQHFMDSSDA
jgi:hypothetical protein